MSLALHQSVTAFMLTFRFFSMSLILKLAYYREVSSANKSHIAFFLTESWTSFRYKENNKSKE